MAKPESMHRLDELSSAEISITAKHRKQLKQKTLNFPSLC